ncbi:hypothetical protein CRE_29208 [Caenorhabditis remanei]|uniref:C2H2-type domain-containing protein n=1 Tax=Caenorhabditis remanei TaxID=31234 RepID=E3NFZ9_CAERE|nr:hypothetical protein CRE_29208 [Caenorhabditis remanei]
MDSFTVQINPFTNARRFVCSCGKKYIQEKSFRKHMAFIHKKETGIELIEVNIYCNFCNSVFNRRDNLSTHLQLYHSSGSLCLLCDKRLDGNETRKMHLKNEHGMKLTVTCHCCNNTFENKTEYNKHIKGQNSQMIILSSHFVQEVLQMNIEIPSTLEVPKDPKPLSVSTYQISVDIQYFLCQNF